MNFKELDGIKKSTAINCLHPLLKHISGSNTSTKSDGRLHTFSGVHAPQKVFNLNEKIHFCPFHHFYCSSKKDVSLIEVALA